MGRWEGSRVSVGLFWSFQGIGVAPKAWDSLAKPRGGRVEKIFQARHSSKTPEVATTLCFRDSQGQWQEAGEGGEGGVCCSLKLNIYGARIPYIDGPRKGDPAWKALAATGRQGLWGQPLQRARHQISQQLCELLEGNNILTATSDPHPSTQCRQDISVEGNTRRRAFQRPQTGCSPATRLPRGTFPETGTTPATPEPPRSFAPQATRDETAPCPAQTSGAGPYPPSRRGSPNP